MVGWFQIRIIPYIFPLPKMLDIFKGYLFNFYSSLNRYVLLTVAFSEKHIFYHSYHLSSEGQIISSSAFNIFKKRIKSAKYIR